MEITRLADDKLERKAQILTLYRLIADYDGDMAKPTDNEALIIAVTGGWGFGKSSFVKILHSTLTEPPVDDPDFKQEDKLQEHQVCYYDAWESDHYDNALDPLFYAVAKNLKKNPSEQAKADANAQLNEVENGLKEAVKNAVGEAVKESIASQDPISASVKGSVAFGTTLFSRFKRIRDAKAPSMKDEYRWEDSFEAQMKLFKKDLEKCIDRKLVVFIDELDRCKPTFAIQTLETVKHLFNVKGMIFIFSLDITQLQHCVKAVYGENFDSVGYLERFFDFTTRLPEDHMEQLFHDIAVNEFKISMEDDAPEQMDIYYRTCERLHLSPREMKAVCFSFKRLLKYELVGYPAHARQLYFHLLALKYKMPIEVDEALYGRDTSNNILLEYPPEFSGYKKSTEIEDPFEKVVRQNKTSTIGNFPGYKQLQADGNILTDEYLFGKANYRFLGSLAQEHAAKGIASKLLRREADENAKPSPLTSQSSLSFILYENDLRLFDQIENYHPLEYLFRKADQAGTPRIEPTGNQNSVEHLYKKGDSVFFGMYTQFRLTRLPIEWIVLDKEEDGTLLLISRYGLDAREYHSQYTAVTWEKCTLRTWLNNDFLKNAFTKEDRGLILGTLVEAQKNPDYGTDPGKNTLDKIFLLSHQDVERYFETKQDRICEATELALKSIHAAYLSTGRKDYNIDFEKNHNCSWWLRSPGEYSEYALIVDRNGFIDNSSVGDSSNVIRPACRVNPKMPAPK